MKASQASKQLSVGVLGVARRGVDEVDSAPGLVDEVTHATARGDLVLPLRVFATAQSPGGETASQAVLPIWVVLRQRGVAQRLETTPGVARGLGAQIGPPLLVSVLW
ncbi:hypothetical protein [Streptosporangium sp. H16]|uniref:hypothetical protein n=1 Tax=Streptosporangium sp. H16 TaxID=3444184 RepID=UPI003F7A1C4C